MRRKAALGFIVAHKTPSAQLDAVWPINLYYPMIEVLRAMKRGLVAKPESENAA